MSAKSLMRPLVPNRSLKISQNLFGTLLIVLGVTVLTGWVLGIPWMTTINPDFPIMRFNLALSFLLLGIYLLINKRQKNVALLLASIVFLFGSLTLSQHIFSYQLGIDTLFMEDASSFGSHDSAGRMSPLSAICFSLIGVSAIIILKSWRRRWIFRLAQLLSVIVAFVGFFSLLGEISDLEFIYHWTNYAPLAGHTAVGFLLSGIAVLCLAWENQQEQLKGERFELFLAQIFLTTSVISVFGISILLIFLGSLNSFNDSSQWVLTTYKSLFQLDATYVKLASAESSMRGYVITKDEGYKKNYLKFHKEIFPAKSELLADVPVDSSQYKNIIQLDQRINERVALMDYTVALVDQNQKQAIQMITRNEGQHLTEFIDQSISEIKVGKFQILAQRQKKADHDFKNSIAVFLVLAGFILILFYFLYRVANRYLYERVENEISIKNLNGQLLRNVTNLKRSNDDLQQFSYVASHDLQEPLRKIQAFGNLLKTEYNSVLPEEGQDYVSRMQNAAKRMQALIESLLSYSRLTSGICKVEKVDLNVTLDEVLQDLEIAVKKNDALVTFDRLPSIKADQVQIRQLFQNLISNSLKFISSDRKPIIKVRLEKETDEMCTISVSDNGVGFDPQYASKLFKPFVRLHDRGTFEGTGIGLAICHRIVERFGGGITAESELGTGSKFTFTLQKK
ncbi:MAG: ATP-binding protein [Verrucomicrobiota bacterium]|nr:ATP-binding protein [Verrucomicrobiota bacterium]